MHGQKNIKVALNVFSIAQNKCAMCALCRGCCNVLHTVHTSRHQTLQHHNGYNRTETIGRETQSVLLMMGVKTPETC